jgi:succinyl-diaminopimelate desuccinylase
MNNEAPLNEIVELTQSLIKIPSTAENITALNEAIRLVEHEVKDFTIKTFNSNGKPSLLIHNAAPDTKHFKIILNAHLDVVQGQKKQFEPMIKNGRLYGRGAYDTKAAVCVMIFLFKELARQVSFPLALQITTDEETGTLGAKKQVDEGYRADFIITGECGSNLTITNKAKGIRNAKLTALGKISHSAYPWRGENAIIKLQKALAVITEKYPLPTKESYTTTINITKITSNNEVWNRTPDHAEAYMDIRYMPEDKNIVQDLKDILPKDILFELIPEYTYSPIDTNQNNPYVLRLRSIGKKILNHDIDFRTAHATSDLVRFAAVGCEGVEFGPIGANQHADNEWIDINSLGDYYQILKQFLLSIE